MSKITKGTQNAAVIPPQKAKVAAKQDVYLEDTEKKYHVPDKMKSLSVLKNEAELCEKIVQYKLDNQFDDEDIWESKKDVVKVHEKRMINIIQNNGIDLEQYKILIQEELDYENKLLAMIAKDKRLKPYEIPNLTERIQTRIKLIQNELAENVDEEEEDAKVEDKTEKNDITNTNKDNKSIGSGLSIKESIKLTESNDNGNNENRKTKENNKANQQRDLDSSNISDSIQIEPKEKQLKISNIKKDDKKRQPPREINQQLLKELEDKFEQYKQAKKYFEDNYYKEPQIQDAINKAKILKEAIDKVKQGHDDKIEPFFLPKKISPEYICGYSREERNSKFNEIITEYTKQKSELQKQIDNINEQIRSAHQKEQSKLINQLKPVINGLNIEKEKRETIIKNCMNTISNPWIPAPYYSVIDQEDKIEKVNESIPFNSLAVYLGSFNYNKSFVHAEIELENNKHIIKPKSKEMFDKCTLLQFEPEVFKNIYHKTLQLGIYKKNCGPDALKGGVVINLEQLESNSEISLDCQIELVSKRTTPILKLKIQVRTPFQYKEFTTKTKKVFKIQTVYPPFKEKTEMQRALTSNFNISTIQLPQNHKITPEAVPRPKASSRKNIQSNRSPMKKSSKQPISPTKKIEAIKENSLEEINIIINTKENLPQEKIDKAQFTEAELNNPDCIENWNSLEVLEWKAEEYNQKMKKIEGKTPKDLRLKYVTIMAKKKVLVEQIQDQEISLEVYLTIIRKQFAHDKLLFKYFKQENNKEKMIILATRLKLLMKEIKDTMDLLKGADQ